jgi:hypothetical protein
VSKDATIPDDGLQGGQTLEEVMEELTDPLEQSSRMDIDEFVPDYDEDSILGNSDTEPVELQELDPGMVDSLLGPSTSTGQTDAGSLGNSKSANAEEPMEEGEETPEKRIWKGDRVPSDSADHETWQPVVSKQTKKQQAKAAKETETEGARSPIRVPPQDSRTPTLTQAQIRKNAREGLEETYGSKSRKGRPRGAKSKGNDPGGSSSKRGRSTSSNGAGAPRKRPDTRERSCTQDELASRFSYQHA